jgi:hypothetical protein
VQSPYGVYGSTRLLIHLLDTAKDIGSLKETKKGAEGNKDKESDGGTLKESPGMGGRNYSREPRIKFYGREPRYFGAKFRY